MSIFRLLRAGLGISILTLALSASVFAATDEDVTVEPTVSEEDVVEEVVGEEIQMEDEIVEVTTDSMCGCGGGGYYGGSGIGFNVSSMVYVEADSVAFNADYSVNGSPSREDAMAKLKAAYSDAKQSLQGYGTVKRTGMNVWSDTWTVPGEEVFTGSISLEVKLNNFRNTSDVEEILYNNGFTAWMNVMVDDTTAAEAKAVSDLQKKMKAKKGVYEELLGHELGEVSALNLYSWVDTWNYDPETNLVRVNVSADVFYVSAN
jgi:hypothetical protein